MKNWILIDGEERARLHPTTFEIPSAEDRGVVRIGDFVKLIFELEPLPKDPPKGERMWVQVVECLATIPRRYVGVLDNDPVVVDGLQCGDRVKFG